MKLLYAEDEPAMAEAVTDILEYHNFTVDTVYDGAEALAYAREEHYGTRFMTGPKPSPMPAKSTMTGSFSMS